MRNGLLAPTSAERMKFAGWLRVFAKDRAAMPLRLVAAINDYHVRHV